MFDLNNFPSRTLPEHRLIAAVVVHAMRDACLPPIVDDKRRKQKSLKMQYNATTAHDFLWTKALDSYLHYLDIDAGYFRQALLKAMQNSYELKIGEFTPENRRIFRINKRLWDALYDGKNPVTQHWSDEDEKD